MRFQVFKSLRIKILVEKVKLKSTVLTVKVEKPIPMIRHENKYRATHEKKIDYPQRLF